MTGRVFVLAALCSFLLGAVGAQAAADVLSPIRLEVTLADESGRPAAGAAVAACYRGTEDCADRAVTDEHGRAVLTALRAGDEFFLIFSVNGLQGRSGYPRTLLGGEEYTGYYVSTCYRFQGAKAERAQTPGVTAPAASVQNCTLHFTVKRKEFIDIRIIGPKGADNLILSQAAGSGIRAVLDTKGRQAVRVYLPMHKTYYLQKAGYTGLFGEGPLYAEEGLVCSLY